MYSNISSWGDPRPGPCRPRRLISSRRPSSLRDRSRPNSGGSMNNGWASRSGRPVGVPTSPNSGNHQNQNPRLRPLASELTRPAPLFPAMPGEKTPQSVAPPPPDAFAFSPDGELFAAVSDGRVQVWRTKGGKMIAGWTDPVAAPDDSYSCIACCSVQKKYKKDGRFTIVAVGTTNGQVLAIDSTGVIWKSACHTGKVVSLHFSKHGRVLYTAGTDGVICELNSQTGESKDTFKASNKSINCMTISQDEKFMGISSKTTRLFSMHDKKEILKIPSAAAPIQLLSVSDDASFLVSCVDNNKEVQVWSCDHDSCSVVSTASFAMHTQPKTVVCTRSTSYEGGGIILAVSKKGVAYVWHLQTLSQDEILPTKISVKNSLDRKGCIPIISAKLCDVKEDHTIKVHIVFGSPDFLQFKVVELGKTCKDINLVAEYDALASKDMLISQERNMEQGTKVNSRVSGEPDLQEITNPTHQGRAKKRTASVLDSTNDTIKEGKPEYNLDEPTMEEKLASLNLLNKSEFTKEQSPSMAPPSADSVHILLKQALRADDHVELLKCLYNRDEKVIVKSISLLMPADVVKLLKFFILQIQFRGATLVCLLPWLRTLLSRHMSSIVSQESSLVLLNSLYQLIDARTSTFKSALQLSTTLDYLFSEIADGETDEEEAAPPIIYEDKDTDEEESEVDAMETDGESEELGDVTDASEHSDGSEIMSD